MTNYKPVSTITNFSKVPEKIMYKRLSHHMRTNNILVPEQFGFRKGLSTEDAACKLTDNVLKSINQKMHVRGIFSDLAKAFSCVNHEILLTKLHFYGIQGTAAEWLRSYLMDRRQKTRIKSSNDTQNFFLKLGASKTCSSPRVNSRAFAFYNIHK
jgi:hypothetical protein